MLNLNLIFPCMHDVYFMKPW